jgi:hypothetical protein
MPVVHPAVAVVGFGVISTVAIPSMIVSVVVTSPVRTSVIRIVSAPSVARITPSVARITPSVGRIVASVIGVSVTKGEAHTPSHSKAHAQAPAETASTISITGIIRIVVVPSVIIIGKPSQVRGVIIFVGIAIIIVVIYNHRCTGLTILVQRIIDLLLLCIKCFASFWCIGFAQHLCLTLQPVLFIIAQVLLWHQGFSIYLCLVQWLSLHGLLGAHCYSS